MLARFRRSDLRRQTDLVEPTRGSGVPGTVSVGGLGTCESTYSNASLETLRF